MNTWELPTSLKVGGVDYAIRTDFRDILFILERFSDPEYEADERTLICLIVLYPDFDNIPWEHFKEAFDKGTAFINAGMPPNSKNRPSLVDWTQDAPIIIPAVNHVIGAEIRTMPYLHWWSFISAYMEIKESLFSTVLTVRHKQMHHKKLDKYEQDFLKENRGLVQLKKKETALDREARQELMKLLGKE